MLLIYASVIHCVFVSGRGRHFHSSCRDDRDKCHPDDEKKSDQIKLTVKTVTIDEVVRKGEEATTGRRRINRVDDECIEKCTEGATVTTQQEKRDVASYSRTFARR